MKKQLSKDDIIRIYRHALINIWRVHGQWWKEDKEGPSHGEDHNYIAHVALNKAEPTIAKAIDDVHYSEVKVLKNGTVKIKGIKL